MATSCTPHFLFCFPSCRFNTGSAAVFGRSKRVKGSAPLRALSDDEVGDEMGETGLRFLAQDEVVGPPTRGWPAAAPPE